MNNSIIIIDNVFEDTSSIDRLYDIINGGEGVGTGNLVLASDLETKEKYSELENLKRIVAKKIWFDTANQLISRREEEFRAFEIWSNRLPDQSFQNTKLAGGNGGLNLHLDKDEELDELSSPIYASAFYLGPKEGVTGGELYINTKGTKYIQEYNIKGGKYMDLNSREWVKVSFRYNRVVLFDSSYPHFVAPIISHPADRYRVTIAVNAWDKERLGIPTPEEEEIVERVTMFH
jgi:hypothetical protein